MSIDPYKGVRDFYPEDQRVQNHIFSAMRRAVEMYGYEEMNASILEATDLYVKKSSEEIVNEQTYTFTDRGDRSVTLRPEMTPTVARMVAAKRRELGFPLRWYSIQNFFRYERPQRGRLREFWQLNADLFGASETGADIEVVMLAYRVMKELGASNTDFTIHISNREFLTSAAQKFNVEKSKLQQLVRIIDKKDKMERQAFMEALSEIFDTPEDARAYVETLEAAAMNPPEATAQFIASLRELGIENAECNPYLARGFDYYTGMVFEVFDTNPENKRAMFGGGRYDHLIESYGGAPTPAVGFAMGDVIARDFLETHKLLPDLRPTASLYLAPVTESDTAETLKAAERLRASGIHVAVGFSHKKLGDHVKAALKLGIPFLAAYGATEKESELLTIKTLGNGAEEKVTIGAAAEYLTGQ